MEYHSLIIKEQNFSILENLESIMLSSQKKNKCYMILLTCGIQKIQQTNEYNTKVNRHPDIDLLVKRARQ